MVAVEHEQDGQRRATEVDQRPPPEVRVVLHFAREGRASRFPSPGPMSVPNRSANVAMSTQSRSIRLLLWLGEASAGWRHWVSGIASFAVASVWMLTVGQSHAPTRRIV